MSLSGDLYRLTCARIHLTSLQPGRPGREAGGGLGGRAPCRGVLRVNERPAEGYKPEAELSVETATTIIPTANP